MWQRFFRPNPMLSDASTNVAPTKFSIRTRRTHRVIGIVFTCTVAANFIWMAFRQPPAWIVYSPLPPLFVQMFSGLYMFALPYLTKWRGDRQRA